METCLDPSALDTAVNSKARRSASSREPIVHEQQLTLHWTWMGGCSALECPSMVYHTASASAGPDGQWGWMGVCGQRLLVRLRGRSHVNSNKETHSSAECPTP
jgi:hypothetical protein